MNRQLYPIYRKDFSVLMKLLIAALFMQALIMYLFPMAVQTMGAKLKQIDEWFPQVQLAIGILVGLIAAGYWYAEERVNNNLCFLLRLPVSSKRIWLEKTLAAISVLFVLLIAQIIWSLLVYKECESFTLQQGTLLLASVFFLSLLAYCVGIPLSRYMKQTISVVLIGLIAVSILAFLLVEIGDFLLGFTNVSFRNKVSKNAGYFICFLASTILIFMIYGFVLLRQNLLSKPKSRFDLIATIYFKQNRLYQFLTAGVFLFSIGSLVFLDLHIAGYMILLVSTTLSIAIGVSTYHNDEKHGLRNIFYYQPVSLSDIYWTRWLCGLFLSAIPAICIVILFFPRNSWILTELHSQYPSHLLQIFIMGLIPFACAAFVTHAIRNTLYAIFESIVALVVTTIFFIAVHPMFWVFYSPINFNIPFANNPLHIGFLPFTWIPFILLAGFAWAGWKAATDRELLIQTTGYRQLHIGRIFFFLMAVLLIVFYTGWKDLFFLTTGIDIGMG